MSVQQQPGWYPVNEGRELGWFDGSQWSGDRVPNPDHTTTRRPVWWLVGFVLLLVALMAGWVGLELFLDAAAG